jgi:hypothetical protein
MEQTVTTFVFSRVFQSFAFLQPCRIHLHHWIGQVSVQHDHHLVATHHLHLLLLQELVAHVFVAFYQYHHVLECHHRQKQT